MNVTTTPPVPTEIPSPSVPPERPIIVYDHLPKLNVPSGTGLVASPLFPKSQLAETRVNAGESVYLIAGDKDNAWLLVIYRNTLGWVPSILFTTGTGVLDPMIVEVAQPSRCAAFRGSITTPDGTWTSDMSTIAMVQGYMYVQAAEAQAAEMNLEFQIEETGESFPAQLQHFALNAGDELIQFHASINDMGPGQTLKYQLEGINQSAAPFQAAFFVDDCSNATAANQPSSGAQVPANTQPPVSTLIVRITSSVIPPTSVQHEPDFANYSCPDKSRVKLRVGDRAVISRDDVNLRSSPEVPMDWDANIVVVLRGGDKMTVIDGPRCAHDGTWWKVETDRGYTGWIREFLPSRILIEPIK